MYYVNTFAGQNLLGGVYAFMDNNNNMVLINGQSQLMRIGYPGNKLATTTPNIKVVIPPAPNGQPQQVCGDYLACNRKRIMILTLPVTSCPSLLHYTNNTSLDWLLVFACLQ